MIIALLVLIAAEFGCFTGFMFVMGYWEFHNRKELKQGLVILLGSLVVVVLCCLYFKHWEEGLSAIETSVEYPSFLEPTYE